MDWETKPWQLNSGEESEECAWRENMVRVTSLKNEGNMGKGTSHAGKEMDRKAWVKFVGLGKKGIECMTDVWNINGDDVYVDGVKIMRSRRGK